MLTGVADPSTGWAELAVQPFEVLRAAAATWTPDRLPLGALRSGPRVPWNPPGQDPAVSVRADRVLEQLLGEGVDRERAGDPGRRRRLSDHRVVDVLPTSSESPAHFVRAVVALCLAGAAVPGASLSRDARALLDPALLRLLDTVHPTGAADRWTRCSLALGVRRAALRTVAPVPPPAPVTLVIAPGGRVLPSDVLGQSRPPSRVVVPASELDAFRQAMSITGPETDTVELHADGTWSPAPDDLLLTVDGTVGEGTVGEGAVGEGTVGGGTVRLGPRLVEDLLAEHEYVGADEVVVPAEVQVTLETGAAYLLLRRPGEAQQPEAVLARLRRASTRTVSSRVAIHPFGGARVVAHEGALVVPERGSLEVHPVPPAPLAWLGS